MEAELLWLEQELTNLQRQTACIPILRAEAQTREAYIDKLHSEYTKSQRLLGEQRAKSIYTDEHKDKSPQGDQHTITPKIVPFSTSSFLVEEEVAPTPASAEETAAMQGSQGQQRAYERQQQQQNKQQQQQQQQLKAQLRRQDVLISTLSQSLSHMLELVEAQAHELKMHAQVVEEMDAEVVEFLSWSSTRT